MRPVVGYARGDVWMLVFSYVQGDGWMVKGMDGTSFSLCMRGRMDATSCWLCTRGWMEPVLSYAQGDGWMVKGVNATRKCAMKGWCHEGQLYSPNLTLTLNLTLTPLNHYPKVP